MRRFPLVFVVANLAVVSLFCIALVAQQPGAPSAANENTPVDDSKGNDNNSSASSSDNQKPGSVENSDYIDPNEPLFTPGPLPKGTVSLVGGTVEKVDRIQNRLQIKVVGGGKMTFAFDERTSIFRDGRPITYEKLAKGDRVYVDTILNGKQVFARSIRINSKLTSAEARGQITSYDPANRRLTLQEELSSEAVQFELSSNTRVRAGDRPARAQDLVPGALVSISFVSAKPSSSQAQEINILAEPGQAVTFAGVVTNLNLASRSLSLANQTDGKTYDLAFDPARVSDLEKLKIGTNVMVTATFSGRDYRAREVKIQDAEVTPTQR